MTLRIIIPGEPHAQGRARVRTWKAKDGRSGTTVYDPKASRDWKATAQQHMRDALAGAAPLQGAVGLFVTALFSCPKSDYRKTTPRGRRRHVKKPDADNILKAVKDAAKGVLWLDDSQVASVSVEKWIAAQGWAPRVEVEVWPLAELAKEIV